MDVNNKNIKAIDKTTVHKICSGQVVLNLATAVKELVENSIDAGATVLDIRLKDYGLESVEVSDNGHGVHPDNFEGLTLKHHTSKLRDFTDLIGVDTYGFRGEALSSLCALSSLSVTTRYKSLDYGTELKFDQNGRILEKKQCARQPGTTINLANLFSSLPVRQKEFHKNIKREFNKMIQLLYAYCLVSTGVKITCVNQTQKGTKTTFVATHGCKSVKENIVSVFGSKQLSCLEEIKQCAPTVEILEDLKFTEDDCKIFNLFGYISSCAHGMGRSTGDRQFFYINSRPCEPSKIIKAVNEIYHQFNLHQTPFIYLNISIAKESVDINVTPDKRQIFFNHEKLLIAVVKASILNTFKHIPSSFEMQSIPTITQTLLTTKSNQFKKDDSTTTNKPNISLFHQWRNQNDNKRRSEEYISTENKKCKLSNSMPRQVIKQDTLKSFNSKLVQFKKKTEAAVSESINCDSVDNVEKTEIDEKNITENTETSSKITVLDGESDTFQEVNLNSNIETCSQNEITSDEGIYSQEAEECESEIYVDKDVRDNNTSSQESVVKYEKSGDQKKPLCDSYVERYKKYVLLSTNLEKIKQLMQKRFQQKELNIGKEISVRFRAAIDPAKNDQAEQELRREISKEKFVEMEIIGQFNLGFIITRLYSDLFIIDQHATDEKYNFETLQKNTIITQQKLVVPQKLELTAANESILMDNIEIFRKNGFDFNIDEKGEPTKKISLIAVPMSRNWVFGKEDVDELIFMLEDSPHTDCRPSRVRSMFASRACRKSVMIGSPLNMQEMKRLVKQMGEIEHPWNCPHGRPTIRHLINLDLLKN